MSERVWSLKKEKPANSRTIIWPQKTSAFSRAFWFTRFSHLEEGQRLSKLYGPKVVVYESYGSSGFELGHCLQQKKASFPWRNTMQLGVVAETINETDQNQ